MAKYLFLILRVALGVFFIYAGVLKIINMQQFAEAIRAYQIMPDTLSNLPALFLPWLEVIIGLFIVIGFYARSSSQIAIALLALFTANLIVAIIRGLEIDCGCGASLAGIEKVSWVKVLENIIMITLFIITLKSKDTIYSIQTVLKK